MSKSSWLRCSRLASDAFDAAPLFGGGGKKSSAAAMAATPRVLEFFVAEGRVGVFIVRLGVLAQLLALFDVFVEFVQVIVQFVVQFVFEIVINVVIKVLFIDLLDFVPAGRRRDELAIHGARAQ